MAVSSYIGSMSMLQPETKTKPLPSSSLFSFSSFLNQNSFYTLPNSFRSEFTSRTESPNPSSSLPSVLFDSIARTSSRNNSLNSKCNNYDVDDDDDNNKSCCHHLQEETWKQLIPLAAVSSSSATTIPILSPNAKTFEQTNDNQMVKLIKSLTNNNCTSGLTQTTSPTMNCLKPNGNMSSTISNHNNKSTRNDTLLDRKAFISLEKSINWQSILVQTNIVDDVVDSTNNSTFNCVNNNNNNNRISESFPAKTTFQHAMEFSFPGMKHVPSWLKLLRLHKYAPIFAYMSYEEMMNLTEQDLERRNITKGARQKLYLSIQKLKARSAVLLASEQQLLHWNSKRYRKNISYSELSQILFQIRAFLSTPIRATTIKDAPLSMDHHHSPTRMLDQTFDSYLVDVNNNNSNHLSNNLVSSPRDKFQTIILCWSMLSNNDLPSIIVRLLGHLINIWTLKCRKHLQQLNLWQDYFKEFYDKLSILEILFELNCDETNKRKRTKMNEFDSDADEDEDDGHDEDDTVDDGDADTSGHESDKENQDDGGGGGFIIDGVGHTRSRTVLSNCNSRNRSITTNTDCDDTRNLEASSLETLDDDTKSVGPCPMVKLNIDREELYNMLKRIIDECLLHEAFQPHQTLLLHLLEQLKYLFFALKIIINNVDVANQTMHELSQTFTAAAAASSSSKPSPPPPTSNIGNHSDMLNNPILLDVGHKTNQQPQLQSSVADNLQCSCVTSNRIITAGNQVNHPRKQNQYCCHHSSSSINNNNNNNEFNGSIVALRLSSTSNQRQSNISAVSSSNVSNMMISSDNYHHHQHHHQHSFSLKQKMNNGGQHQSSLTSIATNNNNNNNSNNNHHHANGRRLSTTNNSINKNPNVEKSGKNLQYQQQNNHHNHNHQTNYHRTYRHNNGNGNNRTRINSSHQRTNQDNHLINGGNRLSSFGDSLENNHCDNNQYHHYTKRNPINHNVLGQNALCYNNSNLQQNGIQSNGPNPAVIGESSLNDSKSSYKRSTPEMNLQNLLLQQLITVKSQYHNQNQYNSLQQNNNNDHNYTNDWLQRGSYSSSSSSSFNNLYSTNSSPLSSSSSSSQSNYCSKSPCDNEALDFENISSPLFDGLHSSNWFDFDQTNCIGKWTNDNEETSKSSFNSFNDLQILECIDWNFIEKSETFEFPISKELDHQHYSSVYYDCLDDNRKLYSSFNYAGLPGSIDDNLSEIPVTTTTTTTQTQTSSSATAAAAAMTSVTFDDIEQLSIRIAEHALEING